MLCESKESHETFMDDISITSFTKISKSIDVDLKIKVQGLFMSGSMHTEEHAHHVCMEDCWDYRPCFISHTWVCGVFKVE